jgi:UDP-2-acetamido-3-amino-2,3-dideoxy-glucuronate N-acetyltransferase
LTKSPNVCVVGCGHWGKNLIRSFSGLQALYGICDLDGERARAHAAAYPGVACFETYEAVLRDPDVDAVVLATPAERHYDMALAALSAGKDLFVEKPLALEWQDGVDMVEAAREHRRVLMVGHLLHYHPAIIRLKELLDTGVLGRIEYIYSNRLSMGKIRREENALWSFAPHDISVILALVGRVPLQVTATGGAYLQPNIADVTISNLLFDHGTRAHIFVSWLHPYKEQRLVVIGSKQMAVFEDSRPDHKLMLFDKRIAMVNGSLEATKPEGVVVDIDTTEPLIMECRHFLDCVRRTSHSMTPGEEGVRVLQVLQACQRSLQLNGEPVQVRQARQKVMAL